MSSRSGKSGSAAEEPSLGWLATITPGPDQTSQQALVRPFEAVAFVYEPLNILGEDERLLRWRKTVEVLRGSGASDAAIETIGARLSVAAEAPATLALFATADGTLLYEQQLPGTDLELEAGCAAPAPIIALLTWAQERPPYVLVVTDRTGAEVTASAGGDRPAVTRSVEGPDDVIERNAPGGWAQARYQRRAEDSWRHNADRVAEEVLASVAEVSAQVLVISGDVRAAQLLSERLPSTLSAQVHHITGSRAADGSQAGRKHRVDEVLREAAAAQTRQVLDRFQSYRDSSDLFVEGCADTIDALAAGRVATLLVSDPPQVDRVAWFGAGATEVYATHDGALLSQQPVRSGPITDVAVRAALLSDAHVRVVPAGTPGEPLDGIGAVCRYERA